MTTALIADDEPALLEQLEHLLSICWPELKVVARAANGSEAQALAREKQPDVAFLDIRMPGATGLEVARTLPEQTRIVFVTAYDQYAVAAFESAAVDYLLKPVTEDRLSETVKRLASSPAIDRTELTALLHSLTESDRPEQSPRLQWLRAGYGDTTRLISVDEAICFEADHKYTNVVTQDGEHVIRTPLSVLEEQLDNDRFWRVHRSYIVNVAAVAEARRDLRGRYVLTLRGVDRTIRTSNAYSHLFRHM